MLLVIVLLLYVTQIPRSYMVQILPLNPFLIGEEGHVHLRSYFNVQMFLLV